MKKWVIAVAALICIMAHTARGEEPAEYLKEVSIPLGDADRGREVFIKYGCFGCHRVARDPGLPSPGGSKIGPVLDPKTAGPESLLDEEREALWKKTGLPPVDYTPEKFFASIMAPSHTIAAGFGEGTPEDEQESDMTDFTDQMTVRELKDVVAYLMEE